MITNGESWASGQNRPSRFVWPPQSPNFPSVKKLKRFIFCLKTVQLNIIPYEIAITLSCPLVPVRTVQFITEYFLPELGKNRNLGMAIQYLRWVFDQSHPLRVIDTQQRISLLRIKLDAVITMGQ